MHHIDQKWQYGLLHRYKKCYVKIVFATEFFKSVSGKSVSQ